MADYQTERRELAARLDCTPPEDEMLRPSELVPILEAWAYCGYIDEDHVSEILSRLCLWVEDCEHHRPGWYLRGEHRDRRDWMDVVEAVSREVGERRTSS